MNAHKIGEVIADWFIHFLDEPSKPVNPFGAAARQLYLMKNPVSDEQKSKFKDAIINITVREIDKALNDESLLPGICFYKEYSAITILAEAHDAAGLHKTFSLPDHVQVWILLHKGIVTGRQIYVPYSEKVLCDMDGMPIDNDQN